MPTHEFNGIGHVMQQQIGLLRIAGRRHFPCLGVQLLEIPQEFLPSVVDVLLFPIAFAEVPQGDGEDELSAVGQLDLNWEVRIDTLLRLGMKRVAGGDAGRIRLVVPRIEAESAIHRILTCLRRGEACPMGRRPGESRVGPARVLAIHKMADHGRLAGLRRSPDGQAGLRIILILDILPALQQTHQRIKPAANRDLAQLTVWVIRIRTTPDAIVPIPTQQFVQHEKTLLKDEMCSF